jgi:hypothetical protein
VRLLGVAHLRSCFLVLNLMNATIIERKNLSVRIAQQHRGWLEILNCASLCFRSTSRIRRMKLNCRWGESAAFGSSSRNKPFLRFKSSKIKKVSPCEGLSQP